MVIFEIKQNVSKKNLNFSASMSIFLSVHSNDVFWKTTFWVVFRVLQIPMKIPMQLPFTFNFKVSGRIGKIIIIFLSLVRKTLVGVSGLDHGVYNTGWFMKSSHKGWESTGWCQTGLLMPIEDLRRSSPQWNFTSVIHATVNVFTVNLFKHPICSVITLWIRSSGNK